MAINITYAGYGVLEKTRDATSEIKNGYASGQRRFLATKRLGRRSGAG